MRDQAGLGRDANDHDVEVLGPSPQRLPRPWHRVPGPACVTTNLGVRICSLPDHVACLQPDRPPARLGLFDTGVATAGANQLRTSG